MGIIYLIKSLTLHFVNSVRLFLIFNIYNKLIFRTRTRRTLVLGSVKNLPEENAKKSMSTRVSTSIEYAPEYGGEFENYCINNTSFGFSKANL